MKRTWKAFGGRYKNPYNAEHSIQVHFTFMKYLHGKFPDDIRKIVASYNCGETRVREMAKKWGTDWEVGIPLETRNYLRRILG
jgi:hypothetical protein